MSARVREAVGGDGARQPIAGRQERHRGRRRQGRRRQDDRRGEPGDRARQVRQQGRHHRRRHLRPERADHARHEDRSSSTDGQKIVPAEKYGLQVISMGFLTGDDAPIIWRGPMLHGALQQFFREVRWVDLDYLIVDMPPGTGDVALSLSQTVPVAGAIVVTTPQQVSLADSRRAVAMYKKLNIPPLGIIENMSYFVCPNCRHEADIFGHGGGERMATELGVPFLGRVPIYQPIREGGDSGVPLIDQRARLAGRRARSWPPPSGPRRRSRSPAITRPRFRSPSCDEHRRSPSTRWRTASTCSCTRTTRCPIVAVNLWYHVGSKNEQPGPHRLRASVRAPDVRGIAAPRQGLLSAAAGRRRVAERIDQRRSHQLLGGGAVQRARARAVDGIGSHGLPAAGADRREVLEPARRRAERAAAELREPALRPGADGDARRRCFRPIIRITGRRSARSPICTPRRSTTCARSSARYYHPANASLALAGDIDPDEALRLARALLRGSAGRARPSRRCGRPQVALAGETRLLLEDRVELPRLYVAWLTPAMFADGDAELDLAADILANGKTSRLYRRLVYERADRDRRVGGAELARDRRLPAGRRDRGARATRSPSSSGRSSTRSRGSPPRARPTTRSSAAASRPKRSSCSGCRPSAASAASPIS